MLKNEAQNLPVLERLESLDLVSFTINDALDPVDLFLRKTPNLKKLILQDISVEKQMGLQSGRIPEIQCENLKTVEIVCLKTDQEIHELVKSLIVELKGVDNISINRVDAIDDSYDPKFTHHSDSEVDFDFDAMMLF